MTNFPARETDSDRCRDLAARLESWFADNARDYPWRRTRDPYAILVSEMMLQQTRIATVLERRYFERWMERFPTVRSLAEAGAEEVLKAWEGLGYYRRARHLQAAARAVVERHQGVFPSGEEDLRALPGIGPYTAGAVASFAFGLRRPLVDGNVARVIARLFDLRTPVDEEPGKTRVWELAGGLVAACDSPAALNSALMELGQTLCLPGKPGCDSCPVRTCCLSPRPELLPLKKARPAPTEIEEHALFARHDGRVLLQQETGPRRTGLWKLPALPHPPASRAPLLRMTYGITRYRVRLHVHGPAAGERAPACPPDCRWVALEDVPALALGSPYRRALNKLLESLC
jgi:A/G-specific adenine glycosylase